MSTQSKLQWVSCLALLILTASCSGMAGSPIQGDLNANEQSVPVADDGALPGGLPAEIAIEEGDKGVAYTPGLPCMIGAGVMTPSVVNYGWMGGYVTEAALAPAVTLHGYSVTGAPGYSWIAYRFDEMVAGRLQNIKLQGSGKKLSAYLYNWNTPGWTLMGTYNLSAATPANIPVNMPYAPNGSTYLILVQAPQAQTTITQVQTDVF
jgi:hypothetical protein